MFLYFRYFSQISHCPSRSKIYWSWTSGESIIVSVKTCIKIKWVLLFNLTLTVTIQSDITLFRAIFVIESHWLIVTTILTIPLSPLGASNTMSELSRQQFSCYQTNVRQLFVIHQDVNIIDSSNNFPKLNRQQNKYLQPLTATLKVLPLSLLRSALSKHNFTPLTKQQLYRNTSSKLWPRHPQLITSKTTTIQYYQQTTTKDNSNSTGNRR